MSPATRAPRTPRFPLVLLLLLLASCVSERITPRRGVPIPPRAGAPAPAGPAGAAAGVPGPIAAPADATGTRSSHVTVSIRPLGRIPYDGLGIPLTSPDGRFIAVQTAPAPPWPAILAQPDPGAAGAGAPVAAGLAVYRVTDSGLEPVRLALPPDVLLLGRSADDSGFLVESPRPGGARWIGRVSWASGNLLWLVATPEVNAHAVMTAAADLLFTRSPDGLAPAVLVYRTPAGIERTWAPSESGGALGAAFPITGADPSTAAVFLVRPPAGGAGMGGGLRIVGLRLQGAGGAAGPVQPVAVATATLAAPATLAGAYQASIAAQSSIPPGAGGGEGRFAVFESGRGGGGVITRFDPVTGSLAPLPAGSIAAVPAREPGEGGEAGWLVAGPRGLFFLPGTGGIRGSNPLRPDDAQRAVNVVAGAYLPRATRIPGRIVLFGAAGSRGSGAASGGGGEDGDFVYEVSVMLLGPDTGQVPAGPS